MTFAWPFLLLALPLVPLGALGIWLLGQRRAQRAAAFGHIQLSGGPTSRVVRVRRRVVAAFYVAGLALLTLAVARPQSVVSLPVSAGTVILAFDVSASMAAADLKPNRMEAAKAAARTFVARQPRSVLVGVVAFSDTGFSVQAPSNDQAAVVAAIDRLTPQRGTSVGRGILDSLTAIALAESDEAASGYYTNRSPAPTADPTPVPPGSHSSAAIVLLTDGENNEQPNPLDAAQAAADRGVRIYPVGIGSPEGATIKVGGFTIRSQLDPETLGQIAALTGGQYFEAQSAADLQRVYDQLDPRISLKPQTTELTAFVTGFGLLLLVMGGLASLTWTGRLP